MSEITITNMGSFDLLGLIPNTECWICSSDVSYMQGGEWRRGEAVYCMGEGKILTDPAGLTQKRGFDLQHWELSNSNLTELRIPGVSSKRLIRELHFHREPL